MGTDQNGDASEEGFGDFLAGAWLDRFNTTGPADERFPVGQQRQARLITIATTRVLQHLTEIQRHQLQRPGDPRQG